MPELLSERAFCYRHERHHRVGSKAYEECHEDGFFVPPGPEQVLLSECPLICPVHVAATTTGRVRFDPTGLKASKLTPAQALRFAAHVRQVALDAERSWRRQ